MKIVPIGNKFHEKTLRQALLEVTVQFTEKELDEPVCALAILSMNGDRTTHSECFGDSFGSDIVYLCEELKYLILESI